MGGAAPEAGGEKTCHSHDSSAKVNIMEVVTVMTVAIVKMIMARDAKSGRCGRYICAIFSAGANF